MTVQFRTGHGLPCVVSGVRPVRYVENMTTGKDSDEPAEKQPSDEKCSNEEIDFNDPDAYLEPDPFDGGADLYGIDEEY